MPSKNVKYILRAAVLLLVTGILTGCSDTREQPFAVDRLLVIGIDAAGWSLLDPMIEEGRLPHLATLRSQSASGRMRSFMPLEKSPVLWASICTGLEPAKHGIGHFVTGKDAAPVRSSGWKAPALWDILGPVGGTTAIIGMWATYPARDINGVMVSDYLQYGSSRDEKREGMVAPDSLNAALGALLVTHEDIADADIERFIAPESIPVVTRLKPRLIQDLKTIFAADLTYLAVARELARTDPFNLFFFYLRGPDMVSHRFWRFLEPDKGRFARSAELDAALDQVVPRYYEWVDEVIAEVLGWFPSDRPVVTLSDHGFFGPRVVGGANRGGTAEHDVFGIFMVRSPLFEAGCRFDQLELLDIAPTMLALLGMPPSQEMPGHILPECWSEDGKRRFERLEKNRIETYQYLAPADVGDGEATPEIDDKIREQLRSLGYI